MYVQNWDIRLKPEYRDEYVRLLVEEVRLAKQREPEIKRFDIMENLDDPNLFHLIEVYTDKSAWERYRSSPSQLDFAKKTQHCYATTTPTRCSEARNLEPLDSEWA